MHQNRIDLVLYPEIKANIEKSQDMQSDIEGPNPPSHSNEATENIAHKKAETPEASTRFPSEAQPERDAQFAFEQHSAAMINQREMLNMRFAVERIQRANNILQSRTAAVRILSGNRVSVSCVLHLNKQMNQGNLVCDPISVMAPVLSFLTPAISKWNLPQNEFDSCLEIATETPAKLKCE